MKNSIDSKKLIKLISFVWGLISLLTAVQIADDYSSSLATIVVAFISMSSPVWVIYLYRWLFNANNIGSYVGASYTLVSTCLSFMFFDQYDDYPIVLAIPLVHLWLVYLHYTLSYQGDGTALKALIVRLNTLNPIVLEVIAKRKAESVNKENANISNISWSNRVGIFMGYAALAVTVIIILTAIEVVSKGQAIYWVCAALIFISIAIFSSPAGFMRKLQSVILASICYLVGYFLLATWLVTPYNIFVLNHHLDTIALVAGVVVQIKWLRHFRKAAS